MIYSRCDLQIAVFLLLSLFWTQTRRHHQIATTNNASTTTTTQPRHHSPTMHKQRPHPASIASPAILPLSPFQNPKRAEEGGRDWRVASWLALARSFSGAVLVPGDKREKRRESLSFSSESSSPGSSSVGVPHSVLQCSLSSSLSSLVSFL